jgi:hypothetical protein
VHFSWKIWRISRWNRATPNSFGAGPRSHRALNVTPGHVDPAVIRRRPRTPRPACVQWFERRAPKSLCATSTGPRPSHATPAHRPHRTARASPLANGRRTPPPTPRCTPAIPRPYHDDIALVRKEAPHRLVLAYKSRRPLSTRVNTELPPSAIDAATVSSPLRVFPMAFKHT